MATKRMITNQDEMKKRIDFLKVNGHKMTLVDIMNKFNISYSAAFGLCNNNEIAYLHPNGQLKKIQKQNRQLFNVSKHENWLF